MQAKVKLYAVTVDFDFKPETAWRLALEEALEPFGAALVSFETDGGKGWHMEVIGEEKPSAAAVKSVLKPFGNLKAVIGLVPDKDWLAESRKGLAPIKMGPFFIHGEHDRGKAPRNVIPLEIDAGMAFGTGRHETTSGCVKALLKLSKTLKVKKALDIGTGTGILAFAAHHLFDIPVMAGDNDKDAVRVARENAAINGLKKHIRIVASDGYRAKAIRDNGPYDLITANILANPLISLAPDLAKSLGRNGRAILSGLLKTQEKDVLAAHHAVGLELDFRIRQNDWSVLVLKKKARR
ncbi:50S ribosomal protein L11 methyltransferase [Dongia rigui]|uniref:Ribosomal protein L11 methyltransferase n=1 Tax=Dongia rigui TaxID=940149 RepID=A0ABU5DVI2_9PROT|nr:50S ribosomal protein L11 methyltransferase [Dongia rigui]MDY0871300.1 50S ribosomal protein L11 methyltransferase [Dongia rigui]